MAGRGPGYPLRRWTGSGAAAGQQLFWFAEWRVPQLIGVFLLPLEAALGPIDKQFQSVFVARCNLARP